jgi:cysteine desulfurase
MVYMDNNATTPLHPEVAEEIKRQLDNYGNPSSMHGPGREARQVIETAREQVAVLINADPEQIIFTSGGSEGNNMALRQAAEGRNEIITTAIEHPSVLETVRHLGTRGVHVHFVDVDETGKVDIDQLSRLCSDRTAMVSVMYANNEIGTIQDLREIGAIAHKAGALFHTDAVQAVGKIDVDAEDLQVDFLTLSGHKIYGPKGAGALYFRNAKRVRPFIHGGHQEQQLRAGTHNTLGIAGLGKAAQLARKEMASEIPRLLRLREMLREGIIGEIPDIKVNGHETDCLPGTLDVSFYGAEGESILLYLDLDGIAVSTGSACATGSLEPSHVLLALGLPPEYAHGSIRFSLGRETTENHVRYVLEKLPPVIRRIRKMSTIYTGGVV